MRPGPASKLGRWTRSRSRTRGPVGSGRVRRWPAAYGDDEESGERDGVDDGIDAGDDVLKR